MLGVLLAGGLGTRLLPLTRAINKHLLPVGPKPMLFWPLERLVEAGIRDVVIVVGGKSTGDIIQTVRDGRELGLERVAYVYQEGEGGIADALTHAARWCDAEDVCVVLGDNVFDFSLRPIIAEYQWRQHAQGWVVVSEVTHPEHYGVATFRDGTISCIVEKPVDPPSHYAVLGVYLYRAGVLPRLTGLTPSARGELEISDLNCQLAEEGVLGHTVVPATSWFDAGMSLDALMGATQWIARRRGEK